MSPSDFSQIEAALGIRLPAAYRQGITSRAERLRQAAAADPHFADAVFLTAEDVIRYNLAERDPQATAAAFPNWWKTFVMVATNGGGDYFCLRLKGDRRVWMIGTDCGDEPTREFDSFAAFLDQRVKDVLDPDPVPSSLNDSLPLLERFQLRWWSGHCTIRVDFPDRPLTAEKLAGAGIPVAELAAAIRAVPAALARVPAEAVRPAGEPAPDDEGLLRFPYEPAAPADPRLFQATIDLFRGNVEITLRLHDETEEEAPPPEQLAVDWDALRGALVRTLETLHPAGTRAALTPLEPDSSPPCWNWSYLGEYTLAAG